MYIYYLHSNKFHKFILNIYGETCDMLQRVPIFLSQLASQLFFLTKSNNWKRTFQSSLSISEYLHHT